MEGLEVFWSKFSVALLVVLRRILAPFSRRILILALLILFLHLLLFHPESLSFFRG